MLLSGVGLRVFEPQPSCSSRCSSDRRLFALDVYATSASAANQQVNATLKGLKFLPDPLHAFQLRHLEQDVRAVDETAFPGVNATEPDALMLWPTWETGFSDTILKTLLPFADAARRGDVPERAILISGSRFPALWAVNRSVCTFERRERITRSRSRRRSRGVRESTSIASADTTAPFRASAAGRLAVRCETACYRSLRLCRQKDVARERAWLACQELNR